MAGSSIVFSISCSSILFVIEAVRGLHLPAGAQLIVARAAPSTNGSFPYTMPHRFGRPVAADRSIPPFIDEAGRLRAFLPPFRFSSFFSPEDTLLCAIAAEAAL